MIISSLANAQSLTQSNEPSIGATRTMYVCDSSYANFNATTGTGVTWDFSAITGYSGVPSKSMSVTAPGNSDFSPATKVTGINGFISSYWTSTSSDRTSQGYVFTEATLGDVIVKFNTDAEKLMNYPFAVTNSFTDNFVGTLSNVTATSGAPIPCTGNIVSSIDGQGTLILPGSISLTDVIRNKVVETSNATITFLGNTVDVVVVRTQYDYFNTAGANALPVFSHINVAISGSAFNNEVSLVLSSVQPTTLLAVQENEISNFNMYPNPSEGKVVFKGDFSENASLEVMDQTGRVVSKVANLNNGTILDLSNVQKGIYTVVISNNGLKTVKSIALN